jgi:hypothetical protein
MKGSKVERRKLEEINQKGVMIDIYMEISQRNSLGSYLYLKQAKCSFFLFSSIKSENRRELVLNTCN